MDQSKKNASTDKFIKILELYVESMKSVLFAFNTENPKEYHIRIFHNILQRSYYGTRSVLTLFKEFEKDINFKFPIGLQVRTCLLDFLTISYLAEFITDETAFKNEIARLNNIGVKLTYKSSKKALEQGSLRQAGFEQEIKILCSNFPDHFESVNNNSLPILNKKIKSISPQKMSQSILNGKLKVYGESYQIYQYYSQYEHYGTFTKIMLDFPPEYEFDKLIVAFSFILRGTGLCYHVMNRDEEIISELNSMITELGEIEPLFKESI